MINGATSDYKLDVLPGIAEIKLFKAYAYNAEYLTGMPASFIVPNPRGFASTVYKPIGCQRGSREKVISR